MVSFFSASHPAGDTVDDLPSYNPAHRPTPFVAVVVVVVVGAVVAVVVVLAAASGNAAGTAADDTVPHFAAGEKNSVAAIPMATEREYPHSGLHLYQPVTPPLTAGSQS